MIAKFTLGSKNQPTAVTGVNPRLGIERPLVGKPYPQLRRRRSTTEGLTRQSHF